MSRAAAESFVPFDPVPPAGQKAGGTAPGLKVVPKSEGGTSFSPLQSPASAHAHAATGAAGQPVVTLQREGERITGIRVECVCGQVIELTCSY
jgi:hypothetical protein